SLTGNAVDANWNVVSVPPGGTDEMGVTASDSTATLPSSAVLVNGTQTYPLAFNTNGSFTVTATDLSDPSKTANTSPSITVNPAQFTQATGGGAIPADGAASGAFTSLTGPVYSENNIGEVGTGTIIINVH